MYTRKTTAAYLNQFNNVMHNVIRVIDSISAMDPPAGRTTRKAFYRAATHSFCAKWEISAIVDRPHEGLHRAHSSIKDMVLAMTNPRTGRPFIALAEPFHRIAAVEAALSHVLST